MKRDTAYKGYLIRSSPFRTDLWIEKDGHTIAFAPDLATAKRIIDELTN